MNIIWSDDIKFNELNETHSHKSKNWCVEATFFQTSFE